MPIDTTKPVKLLRHIFKNGNAYHPGVYQPGELPKEYLVEGVVSQGENPALDLPPRYGDIGRQVSINLSSTPPVAVPTTFGEAPAPIVSNESVPAPVPNLAPARIEVNTAPLDRMTTAFGAIAANSISENRETKPFTNLADLKKRVSIKEFDWDKFSEQIIF